MKTLPNRSKVNRDLIIQLPQTFRSYRILNRTQNMPVSPLFLNKREASECMTWGNLVSEHHEGGVGGERGFLP